jgi:hypothetical protein
LTVDFTCNKADEGARTAPTTFWENIINQQMLGFKGMQAAPDESLQLIVKWKTSKPSLAEYFVGE